MMVAIKFALHALTKQWFNERADTLSAEVIYIALSAGFALKILQLINRKCMWKWWLSKLALTDIRGSYTGHAISSFHDDDDPSKPFIRFYCQFTIIQNLNGFHVHGSFYSDEKMASKTSQFTSSMEEIKKLPDKTFHIHYFFNNTGDQFHPFHLQYGLNNHTGVCVLTFYPASGIIDGYYFNRERTSSGKLFLQQVK
jgi:hypothetical protein